MPAALELAIEALESPRRGGRSKRLSARRAAAHASCEKQKVWSPLRLRSVFFIKILVGFGEYYSICLGRAPGNAWRSEALCGRPDRPP